MLIWNIQRKNGTPFQVALNAFWNDGRYWTNDRALKYGSEAWKIGWAPQEVLEPFFKAGVYWEEWFDNPLRCNLDGLKGRIKKFIPPIL